MSDFAHDVYEPLSFSAAQPGWRALYVDPQDLTDHFTCPLVGWAVYRVTVHDSDTNDQLPQARQQIEGVVLDGSYTVCVLDFETGFWTYLGPDEPDPPRGSPPPGVEPGKRNPGQRPSGKRPRGSRFTAAGAS
jgi:hypothetical protein